MELSDKITD